MIAFLRSVFTSRRFVEIGIPALIAYVPLLLTQPGQVAADTKPYLYTDPGRLLSAAPYMWQPDTGLGTVTHQNVGYIWPMGPWFWLFEQLRVPDWVAQRLWLGTILFLAALGVRYMLKTLGWKGPGLVVAALAFMLSPYLFHYWARTSVLLLPFAALPWMIALTDRSVRSKGWRYPALFGLVVVTIGAVNLTALVLVGIAPLLWLVHVVFFDRSATGREAVGAALRIGAVTLVVNLWWLAGLAVQAFYGLPVTLFTEAYQIVANSATSAEALRGFGYWLVYGADRLGPWITAGDTYTDVIWVLALSFVLPLLAWLVIVFARWRHRAYFLLIMVVGVLITVGGHPVDDSSVLGGLFAEWAKTELGLSMRSTPRALPMLILGVAVFLGIGVNALAQRRPSWATPAGVLVALLVILNLSPMWMFDMIEAQSRRDEDLPEYWIEAAEYVDERDDGTRVLELPGTDLADYRWGYTTDPITPGLIDRAYIGRDLVPQGSEPSAEFLLALDVPMQDGVWEVDALEPVAQLMAVGDVIYRADLRYERHLGPRPRDMWAELLETPGLGEPELFGADVPPNLAGPEQTLIDEIEVGTPADQPYPPAVAVFPVEDPRDVVRTLPAAQPQILVGNADGLVSAAAADLVDPDRLIVYAASTAGDPALLDYLLGEQFELIVTDTNRKQARSWGEVRDVLGATETAGSEPEAYDFRDGRLDTFPEAEDETYEAVAEYRGGATATATAYGNPATLTPSDRAFYAMDGDAETAWRVAAFGEPRGERLVIRFDEPTDVSALNLLQPINRNPNRHITAVKVEFDDESAIEVELGESSLSVPGQLIEFPERTVEEVEIEILDTNVPPRLVNLGLSSVGFAEVGIADTTLTEVIRVPQFFLAENGEHLDDHAITLLFTRLRVDPREPVRADAEFAIHRAVDLPVERDYDVGGSARLSAHAPEGVIDELVGLTESIDGESLQAHSSGSLNGDLGSRAWAAFDGDSETAWTSTFAHPGPWIEAHRGSPVEIDEVGIVVRDAENLSSPSRVTVFLDGVAVATQSLTAVEAPTTIEFPSQSASTITLRFEVEPKLTHDWHSDTMIPLPVSVASVEADGFEFAPGDTTFDTGCRSDLLSVDGDPIDIRVVGEAAAALDREVLPVEACEGAVTVGGDVDILAAPGAMTGIDLDKIIMASPAPSAKTAPPPSPDAVVLSDDRVNVDVELDSSDDPYWLVLGQSRNLGWEANAEGFGDLGDSTLVQGFANGWLIEPPNDEVMAVSLEWAPQRWVFWAFALSVAGILAAIVLVLRGRRVGARAPDPPTAVIDPQADAPRIGWPLAVGLSVGMAVVAALNLDSMPLMAVLIGASLLVSLRIGRDIAIPALAALGAFGITALYVVLQQFRHDFPLDFVWPMQFERVHTLGVVAVLFLAAEVVRVVTLRRSGARDRRGSAADADDDETPDRVGGEA